MINKNKFFNTKIKKDIFIVFLFIIFLILFPILKENINKDQNSKIPVLALNILNNTSNFIYGVFSFIPNYFENHNKMLNEIDRLNRELQKAKEDNTILSNRVQSDINSENNIVISKKIFSDFTHIYSTIILNKGSDDNVSVGDIVFVFPNKVVGEIISVNKNTSVLSLYSKDNNKVSGILKILGENNFTQEDNNSTTTISDDNDENAKNTNTNLNKEKVLNIKKNTRNMIVDIFGYGSGDFIAKLPSNLELEMGSQVYLAGEENKILGEIVNIKRDNSSFYETILIRGYYNSREDNDFYIKKK